MPPLWLENEGGPEWAFIQDQQVLAVIKGVFLWRMPVVVVVATLPELAFEMMDWEWSQLCQGVTFLWSSLHAIVWIILTCF